MFRFSVLILVRDFHKERHALSRDSRRVVEIHEALRVQQFLRMARTRPRLGRDLVQRQHGLASHRMPHLRGSNLVAASLLITLAATLVSCSSATDASSGAGADPESFSLSPAADTVYQCLRDRGWDVTINWDGGIEANSSQVPSGQQDLYVSDEKECWALIDDRIERMDSEAIADVYKQELATRECLIDHGFDVDPAPSEQQYIDSFHDERWMAYGASTLTTTPIGESEFREVSEKCPQPAWSLGASE